MENVKTNNVTVLDLINARTSTAFKDISGVATPLKACAVATDPTDGNDYGYIWDEDGNCYAGNSASIMEQISQVVPLVNEGMKLDFTVISRKSKQGKDFLSLKIDERY